MHPETSHVLGEAAGESFGGEDLDPNNNNMREAEFRQLILFNPLSRAAVQAQATTRFAGFECLSVDLTP